MLFLKGECDMNFEFSGAQLTKIYKLPNQYRQVILKAQKKQQKAFAAKLDEKYEFCELGSLGSFMLKRGNEYCWIDRNGKIV